MTRSSVRPVAVVPGPDVEIEADGDQLEQLLINLVRNAVDAAQETGGGVRVGWSVTDGASPGVEVWVEDDGPGLASTENLFVPFFTTKPDGAGIGLALSRQIAEVLGDVVTALNSDEALGEVLHLIARESGRLLGADAVVIGEERIINPEGLRYDDEFVRHKALDAVGDLTLAGAPIRGCYRSYRGGHRLNVMAVGALLADKTARVWAGERTKPVRRQSAVAGGVPVYYGPDVS